MLWTSKYMKYRKSSRSQYKCDVPSENKCTNLFTGKTPGFPWKFTGFYREVSWGYLSLPGIHQEVPMNLLGKLKIYWDIVMSFLKKSFLVISPVNFQFPRKSLFYLFSLGTSVNKVCMVISWSSYHHYFLRW